MIFLTGFMGAGKTSAGKKLSKLLGVPFVDMDDRICVKTGSTIPEIFKYAGEPAFRALEQEALADIVKSHTDCVIATGGGVPENPDNRALMKSSGSIVHLQCSLSTLKQRVKRGKGRPLWGKDIEKLFLRRQHVYNDADLIIDTEGIAINDIAKKISISIKKYTQIPVLLPSHPYPVYIGEEIFKDIRKIIHRHLKPEGLFILIDETVAHFYMESIKDAFSHISNRIMTVPSGEDAKSSGFLARVLDSMLEANINRNWACVAIGGGVVGDLAGFAASIIMRGIPFIQIPTTLLAQVDASIGGKTGINHEKGKNLIGTFYQPEFVLCDVSFLKTLTPEVLRSALAEVVKYGIIMDKPLFQYLESTDQYDYKKIITMCARDKAHVVSMDEKEGGLRRILNFGHTLGHAIEKMHNFEMLHGHAVGIGMLFAAWLSKDRGLLKEKDMKRIEDMIRKLCIPDHRIALPESDALNTVLALDKKAYKQGIQFVLTQGIGDVTVKTMSITDIIDAYRRFLNGYKESL